MGSYTVHLHTRPPQRSQKPSRWEPIGSQTWRFLLYIFNLLGFVLSLVFIHIQRFILDSVFWSYPVHLYELVKRIKESCGESNLHNFW